MLNDPDGRCPMCIGFMIGMFTSAIGNAISGKMPSNIGQFLLPGVTGAIGGGVGAGMAGIFGQAGTFGGAVLRGAAGGAISGGISGGVGSMLSGGSFGNGFLDGAISGGISGGLMGGIGHLSMQAKIAASIKMPNGYSSNSELPFNKDFLNEFAETNFGGDFADKYGVNYLTTADEYRTQQGIEYNPQTGDLQSKTSVVDGVTVYNNSTKNPMSDVYISKGAFISPSRLFSVVGHEFVHSSHYKMGLFGAMIKQFGDANGTKLFYRYSEASAYSFTLASAKSMGNTSYANFIRNNIGSNYNFQTVTIFGWRRLGLPLQVK